MPKLTKVGHYREQQFLTLDALAEKARVSLRTAWKAANGQTVSFATVKKLAEALGVKPESLR